MNVILLSGGSGKRLWPLSNDIRSKQFLKIFKGKNEQYESMVQRIFRQIRSVDPKASILIATSKSQVSALHNQVGSTINISIEPERKDTFPAIALATAYLHDVMKYSEEEAVVVCPVDPYVEDDYFNCVRNIYDMAKTGDKNLILMGIQPTYPSEKYGYIIPGKNQNLENYSFVEKPDSETAKELIANGALWNGGVFAYKLKYVLEKTKEIIGYNDYQSLFSNYDKMNRISFDYAVVEKEHKIAVLQYSGAWKDLGTWNTLTEAMEEDFVGNVRIGSGCENVHAINEMGIPLLCMGLKDLVISASPEGILVSDKAQSAYIKPYVDMISQQIMFADKSWGSYLVVDVEENSMTVKVTLNPNQRMNYHSHDKRDEIWIVIAGSGETIVDGVERPIKVGEVIVMATGSKHAVIAGKNGLQMIEIQLGSEISVSDKKKYIWPR